MGAALVEVAATIPAAPVSSLVPKLVFKAKSPVLPDAAAAATDQFQLVSVEVMKLGKDEIQKRYRNYLYSVRRRHLKRLTTAFSPSHLESTFSKGQIGLMDDERMPNDATTRDDEWSFHHAVPTNVSGMMPNSNIAENIFLLRRKLHEALHTVVIDPQIKDMQVGERRSILVPLPRESIFTLSEEAFRASMKRHLETAKTTSVEFMRLEPQRNTLVAGLQGLVLGRENQPRESAARNFPAAGGSRAPVVERDLPRSPLAL